MIKVVLHNNEDDELELGPFRQGVTIRRINEGRYERIFAVDISSSNVIAVLSQAGWRQVPTPRGTKTYYAELFTQDVPLPDVMLADRGARQRIMADLDKTVEALNGDWRIDPVGGNAMALREISRFIDGQPSQAHITDVLGGHDRWLPINEWESWQPAVDASSS